jgi:hypothetical protein
MTKMVETRQDWNPMNETKHNAPYWTRAHRDWRVWIGVVLMLAAMSIYLMTGDFRWKPQIHPRQPLPNNASQ